jgi:hypothetical protein
MRRDYISPEFDYTRTFGTYDMTESSSLLGSKMLEIEDELDLHNQSIIYYQNLQKEQIDLSVESSLPAIIYSVSDDKKSKHTLSINDTQNEFQRNGNTKYILTIQIEELLIGYIFATLKNSRTFEGIRNKMCRKNDVDGSISEYIIKNVLNRYKLDKIDLYLKYNDLRSQTALRFSNKWSSDIDTITTSNYLLKKLEIDTSFDRSSAKINFNQEKSSQNYNFDYYFKLNFKKI